MPRWLRTAVASAAATLVVPVTWMPFAPSAAAAALPYTDNAVTGSVGLCNAAGGQVTHGNVNDKPFVWRAVSSTPARVPYDGAGRKATLIAFQPRTGANPSLWSGDTLTSSSTYTNPRYPMAQATARDFTLKDFLAEFPPLWDGLIQLRIYLSAPGQQASGDSYPATDIRISGNTWSVVRGASVPCTDGSATASETVPASGTSRGSATGVPPSRRSVTPHSTAAVSPSRSGAAATATVAPAGGTASASTAAGASATSSSGSASKAPAVLAGLGATVVAGLGAAYWWRRRRAG